MKYQFPIKIYSFNFEKEATRQYDNIRSTIGLRHEVARNFKMGLGLSLDYSDNFRYHDGKVERLDTMRLYNITRDLGLNFNATYHLGNFFLSLQINKAFIPIVNSENERIMEYIREIEPLSAIVLVTCYSIRY